MAQQEIVSREVRPHHSCPCRSPHFGFIKDLADDRDDEEHSAEEEKPRLSKLERKWRKAMDKVGMKLVPGVTAATIVKGGQPPIFVQAAEAYTNSASDTYVIFGEVVLKRAAAAQQFAFQPSLTEVDKEEEEAASEVCSEDIELVMKQAKVSRAKAVRALQSNNGDLVSAIMQLTE